MAVIDLSIVVGVPLHAAYVACTRYADLPRYIAAVDGVRQIGETTLEWRSTAGDGTLRTGRVHIVERVPDQRLTWISADGARKDGSLAFASVDDHTTRVSLLLLVDPAGEADQIDPALRRVREQARRGLERFRDAIEADAGGPDD